jgi:hypothetical protein
MPSFRTGTVTAILSERPGLQRVEVDGERAYVLTQLVGPVALGHRVVVNTTAVELGLGTGGWHVVHWDLARETWSERGPGDVMKLRYTSLQVDAGAAEATAPDRPPHALRGAPVVACGLHSQVACVAVAFKHLAPGRRLAYVMTDAAALPLALSDLVVELRERGLLDATVTAGHAFGGDQEAVNLHSALGVSAGDAVIVGGGPGVVGTASRLGFSGMEVATIVDVAAQVQATPVVAVRYSDADTRERHRGVSHHTLTALAHTCSRALVPVPRGASALVAAAHDVVEVDVPDMGDLLGAHGLEVTSMGRGLADDPGFFRYAAAAGVAAALLVTSPPGGPAWRPGPPPSGPGC